ncbi:MAG: AAC(3) family N-acetyltransferase [Pseudomonadota bacterium]
MPKFATVFSLEADFNKLGLAPGDSVFVHASMRAIGPIVGGARAVIQALLSSVGPEGLVAMPGFSSDAYMPTGIDIDPSDGKTIAQIEDAVLGFDAATSPADAMGIIAETFRTWPGTRRSPHPTTSVCLNGAEADSYATEHSLAWATGAETPFGKLYARPSSKILLIGVGWNRCTAFHTAETFAPTRREKTRRFKSGGPNGTWMETPDVADDVGRLFPAIGEDFVKAGRVTSDKIGQAASLLCDFRELVDFASDWIDAANIKSGDRA